MSDVSNPHFLNSLYWITVLAVVVSSASGVLKAGFKKFDLFGVIIIGITTGLGGGSLRDMLLNKTAFWISNDVFFIASLGSSIAIFIVARMVAISPTFFLIPDAAGLATFGVAGTSVALAAEAPWMVASFMGVMTALMGGIFRDILCNETPVVFHSPLYATVTWSGSLLFIGLLHIVSPTTAAIIAGITMFVFRLLAIRFNICLPKFSFKT
jgi:uncharacterized membrane protein YeiH